MKAAGRASRAATAVPRRELPASQGLPFRLFSSGERLAGTAVCPAYTGRHAEHGVGIKEGRPGPATSRGLGFSIKEAGVLAREEAGRARPLVVRSRARFTARSATAR